MAIENGRPAVFLDKDGTLIDDVPYNVRPELIRFAPGAPQLLRALHAAGYLLIVVSNQSGVGRGYFPESALTAVEAKLREMASSVGAPIAGFYWCPHYPESRDAAMRDCNCRKPAPGMLLRAGDEHGIDTTRSWLIGDILDDIEAGNRAGVRTILLDIGHETEWQLNPLRMPAYFATSLVEAGSRLLAERLPVDVRI